MQLYAGTSKQFVDDAVRNRIGEKLKTAFFRAFRYDPPASEVRSWQNSLTRMSMVMQHAALMDHGVLLEYQLPLSSKRLDCMVTGHSKAGSKNAVIVELKQWEQVEDSDVEDCVLTFVGGAKRTVLHPSKQVGQYQQYLADCHTVFSEGAVGLASCSYLHNHQHESAGVLFQEKHTRLLDQYPLYTGDQYEELSLFLSERLSGGDGGTVLSDVLQSKYRASKKLLDHTSEMIRNQKVYVLLDEQQVVLNSVLQRIRTAFHSKKKVVVLVKGGPGTGKSVVALNLVAELSARGFNAQHATGSQAFTENLRKIVGSRAAAQFKYFNSYMKAEENDIDVLILDEAHRLRPNSANRFTPKGMRSDLTQIQELISAAKVTVFFIDDLQIVRPGEVGNSDLIRATASRENADLEEFELEAQFRCSGSDAYLNWVDNTLGIRRTANVLWDANEEFEFKIFGSVKELQEAITEKQNAGFKARLTAGFCWPWSEANTDGTLQSDVQLGEWKMPWNAKPDSKRLAAGIPKSHFWATDPNGINQVGCVYTAQGFEFDFVGVIFGLDLKYDPVSGDWIGDKSASFDSVVKRGGDAFTSLVKNTYRVLLTRGMKGCYVYFTDSSTANFFRSRIERQSA